MNPLSDYDYPDLWATVRGIDWDGPTSRQYLEEMFAGRCSRDQAGEALANLSRDGMDTTAGFAAVPLLLLHDAPDPYTAHLMAFWAGLILAELPDESQIPAELHPHVTREFKDLAHRRMLETAAEGELEDTLVLQFCEVLLKLEGRSHLADLIGKIIDDEILRRVDEANRLAREEGPPPPKITMSGSLTETFRAPPAS